MLAGVGVMELFGERPFVNVALAADWAAKQHWNGLAPHSGTFLLVPG